MFVKFHDADGKGEIYVNASQVRCVYDHPERSDTVCIVDNTSQNAQHIYVSGNAEKVVGTLEGEFEWQLSRLIERFGYIR